MIDAPRDAHSPAARDSSATIVAAATAQPAIDAVAAPDIRPAPERLQVTLARPLEKVIPLVHVPDDPGPDVERESEPQAETHAPEPAEGWRRFRQLFRS
jgi:hypothetical protein